MPKTKKKNKTCRICMGNTNPFIAPCNCTGSMKHVHSACLEQWRKRSSDPFACDICKDQFALESTSGVLKALRIAYVSLHTWLLWLLDLPPSPALFWAIPLVYIVGFLVYGPLEFSYFFLVECKLTAFLQLLMNLYIMLCSVRNSDVLSVRRSLGFAKVVTKPRKAMKI